LHHKTLGIVRARSNYAPHAENSEVCFVLIAVISAVAAQYDQSRLRSIAVKRPNIIVRGAYLSKVEVWAVPTGTEITEDEYELLGDATRSNSAGPNEVWTFSVPCNEFLATEVFVTAFDSHGKAIGTKSLPYQGATELFEAVCGK